MLTFALGIELTENDNTKVIPITRDLFHPDVYVMIQKIIRFLFPDAAPGFIKTLIESNALSPLKLYPLIYTEDTQSIITPINVASEFALFTKMATGKSLLESDNVIEIISSEIDEIVTVGFKQYLRGNSVINTNVKSRSINVQYNKTSEVVAFHVNFVTQINKKFIVKVFDGIDLETDTVNDLLMNSTSYFNISSTKKLPETKLSYELEIGYVDLKNEQFVELCEYLPNNILTDNIFDKKVIRASQYKPDVFCGNILQQGAAKITKPIERKMLVHLKQIKFIGV